MTIASPRRVLGYDLARAAAIVGMVLINFQVFLLQSGDSDPVLRWLAHLPSGRASALFVTLAGVGIALMTDGADPRRVRRTLLLRAAFLLVAGNLLILVWSIDILHFYGFYLGLAALGLAFVPRPWLPPVGVGITALAPVLRLAFPDVSRPDMDAYWTPLGMLENVVGWGLHPLSPWLAFLVLGLWIGRFELRDRTTRRRLMLLGGLLAVTAELVAAGLSAVIAPSPQAHLVASHLGTGWSPDPLYVVAASGTSLFAVGAAQEVVERFGRAWLTRALVALGQLSLSVYLLHALLGVGVPRWALDLGDAMSLSAVVVWTIAFSGASTLLAWLWRRRFSRGPAEWVMRKVSGPTPPRVTSPARAVMGPVPEWPWGVVGFAAAIVLGIRFVGVTGQVGCPPEETVTRAHAGELTLTCDRRSYDLVVSESADVTLETHSDLDLYLELFDGDERIAENDDGGDTWNARLVATLEPGRYRVLVRPFRSALGRYLLTRDDGPPSEVTEGCSNTCASSHDDECDDGGEGSLYDVCDHGTDCADCGPRDVTP